jgi:ectoine hydrolase
MRNVPGLNFTLDEYSLRLKKVHAEMDRRGIDLLVLSDPCNIYYVSGYDAWSFYVPQVLLVRRGSDRPVWIGREMDAGGAHITSCLEADDVKSYGDQFVQAADAHPMSYVAQVVRERGWASGRIAAELGSYYLGVRAYETLRADLPQARFLDGSLIVNWVRSVKSDAELRFMREAARIIQSAMKTALEQARPGVRQCDVAAEIYRSLMRGTPEYGGQYASTPPLMPSGERVNNPHLSWTSEPYRKDSLVNFELVASRHRYHMPLSRSLHFGKPPAQTRNLEAATLDGIGEVLSRLKPGMTAAEAEGLWQGAAAKFGVQKRARCGYSIGIAYPPTFGEQTFSLRPGDTTVLQKNMTMHLMPAVWQDGASIVITEPLFITETGCETFCQFERKLFVVD